MFYLKARGRHIGREKENGKNYDQSATWNRVLLDKLTAPHLDKKFLTFHGI
jgi:hypothetical protein